MCQIIEAVVGRSNKSLLRVAEVPGAPVQSCGIVVERVGDRMGPVPYGPIMTSSAISKSPIWFQQASHNDVSKQ